MVLKQRQQLNERLKVSLADYISANADSDSSIYRTKKEVALARFVLDEGIDCYLATMTALKKTLFLLNSLNDRLTSLANDPLNAANGVGDIELSSELAIIGQSLNILSQMEDRSYKVINAVKAVTSVAKTGAEIESLLSSKLDVVQVYSLLTQLPQILSSIIASTLSSYFSNLTIQNGRVLSNAQVIQELSSILVSSFNEEIERSVNVLTYSPQRNDPNVAAQTGGVVESQVVAMLRSVPDGTVYSTSEVPAPLRSLLDVEEDDVDDSSAEETQSE